MDHQTCPVCGNNSLVRSSTTISITDPFIGTRLIVGVEYQCSWCHEVGDFFGENDALIDQEKKIIRKETVKFILSSNQFRSRNFAGIERALALPQRTLTKWKSGKNNPTPADAALVKMISIFPWLIDVADHHWDRTIAQMIHAQTAMNFTTNLFEVSPQKNLTTITSTDPSVIVMSPLVVDGIPYYSAVGC